ncbi:hypothetical protein OG799_12270 [Micromonospora sp. NBC_00898]|uniref:hypothetical protein n=1 Tax=Micromonospora sp. NBC_00898 TaxID=2975981 RepID=UPI003868F7FD|nr:hypothetical protein OG799_12270 [Micromonospora sp. NBC_00898]
MVIAAEDDVDRWLARAGHDELIDPYGESGVLLRRVGGAAGAVSAPAEQTSWLASASGTGAVVLDRALTDGRFVVVLANVDGSPDLAAGVQAATRIPDLTPLGVALLVGGVIAALAALALIYAGASRRGAL